LEAVEEIELDEEVIDHIEEVEACEICLE